MPTSARSPTPTRWPSPSVCSSAPTRCRRPSPLAAGDVLSPALLGGPMRFWLGYVDDEPVAVSAAFCTRGLNLVTYVAALPAARGRGSAAGSRGQPPWPIPRARRSSWPATTDGRSTSGSATSRSSVGPRGCGRARNLGPWVTSLHSPGPTTSRTTAPSTVGRPSRSRCGARSSAACCARSATASRTLAQVAETAGMSVQYLSEVERGRKEAVLGDAGRRLRLARTEPGAVRVSLRGRDRAGGRAARPARCC